MNTYKIFAVNPGSTSTKIALYNNLVCIYKNTIYHSKKELENFCSINDQKPYRLKLIMDCLKENCIKTQEFSAVVGRGGVLAPIKSGAYIINDLLLDRITNRPLVEHASNLGAQIAYDLSKFTNIPSFIYDGVTVDEIDDIARLTGHSKIKRQCHYHVLNMRAAAIKFSEKNKIIYKESCFIVTHLGSGITSSVHDHGLIKDIVLDCEGPFSPERSGRIPPPELLEYMIHNNIGPEEMYKEIRKKCGIYSYFNTNNVLDVFHMAKNGDEKAKLVLEAMAYQTAKSIGELATVVSGKVDHILLTGNISKNEFITNKIAEKIQFIAPVEIIAGEYELEAMISGVLRVLNGEEKVNIYDVITDTIIK